MDEHKIEATQDRDVRLEIKALVQEHWENRKDKSLTQIKLAEELGVKPETVSRLLHKRDGYWWSENRLKKFANFIKVRVGSLIPEDQWMAYPSVEENNQPLDYNLKIFEGLVGTYIVDYVGYNSKVDSQLITNIARRLSLLLEKQYFELEKEKTQQAIARSIFCELINRYR